jgi:uncharacterized lipoprotein YmbA
VAFAAVEMLEDIRSHGDRQSTLAAEAVAVVSVRPGTPQAVVADVREVLTQAGVRILEVPFDQDLASGERVVYPQLVKETTRAWVRVAAQIADAVANRKG